MAKDDFKIIHILYIQNTESFVQRVSYGIKREFLWNNYIFIGLGKILLFFLFHKGLNTFLPNFPPKYIFFLNITNDLLLVMFVVIPPNITPQTLKHWHFVI